MHKKSEGDKNGGVQRWLACIEHNIISPILDTLLRPWLWFHPYTASAIKRCPLYIQTSWRFEQETLIELEVLVPGNNLAMCDAWKHLNLPAGIVYTWN